MEKEYIENKYEHWAYIEELDKVVEFRSCTSNKYHITGCPKDWEETYSINKYIGSGYTVNYLYNGEMNSGTEKLYFYR